MLRFSRRLLLSGGIGFAAARYPEWKRIGPWGGSARTIRLDPKEPNKLFAIPMRGSGVFSSRDAGQSWTESTSFPTLANARLDCAWLTRGAKPLWLVGAAPGGLWISDDEGGSWRCSPQTERLSVYAITSWAGDERVLALGSNQGVWISHDAAQTWRRISPANNADLSAIVSVAFDPKKAGTLFAGTPHLPWKTTNGGVSWQKAHVGLYDDSDIFSIAIDPRLPTRVFASACSGIYCSLNAGSNWRRVQGIPGSNRRTYVVAQDPLRDERVYAGTSAGMWASSDHGKTWKKLNSMVATSIAFHPRRDGLFYVSTERHGLQMTENAGASFVERNQGFVSRSLQGVRAKGDTWQAIGELEEQSESLPAPPKAYQSRRDPFSPQRIWAATASGLLESLDEGKTWRRLDQGLGEGWIRSIAFDPKRKGRAFALRGQRVFWTGNHGSDWYWLPAEESASTRFWRLDMVSSEANLLFATSEDRGIYQYQLD